MRRRRVIALAVGAVVVVGAGVGGFAVATANARDGSNPSRAATDRACGRAYVQLDVERPRSKEGLRARPVGAARNPSALALDPRRQGRAFLGERSGRVLVVEEDRIEREVVLDLTGDTNWDGDGGLLAMTVDPAGEWLYVYRTTFAQDDVITAYPLDGGGLPDVHGEVVIVEVDHPTSPMHHGGAFGFGPDGFLYAGFGDGGGLGDPRGNAQDGSTLLGKVIRIEPTPGEAEPYRVPGDNPYVGRDGWRPEIWVLGVRNPFRLTFDTATGELWLGDVGQSCWEELDLLRPGDAGANLGWDHREGTASFEGGDVPGHSVEPVHTYGHRGGNCAVVVGVVVRGSVLPSLPSREGWTLYSDFCNGRIMAFHPGGGGEPPRLLDTGARVESPVAIASGPDGAVWVLSLEGPVYRLEERNP